MLDPGRHGGLILSAFSEGVKRARDAPRGPAAERVSSSMHAEGFAPLGDGENRPSPFAPPSDPGGRPDGLGTNAAGPVRPAPTDLDRAAARLAEVNLTLLAFFLEMTRGMEEFRRANEIPAAPSGLASATPSDLSRRLLSPGDGAEAMRRLTDGMQELKVHHAALLEGYHQATHEGARRLLERLDPEAIRREFEGGRVRVGPLSLSARFRPVLVQAVWEEFLRRQRLLAALEPGDLERFFRDGFRQGYWRFREARLGKGAGAAAAAAAAGASAEAGAAAPHRD